MKLSDRLNCLDLEALKLKQTIIRRPTDDEPISRTLYQIYHSKNPTGKPHVANQFLASIIDACCNQLLTEFLLSHRILEDLIKNNPNISRKTCSGLEYKLFMKEMISGGVLGVIDKPSVYGKEHGKAGKYKILYSEVIDYIQIRKEIYKQKAKQEADEKLRLDQVELLKKQEAEKAEVEVLLNKPNHLYECECSECMNYMFFESVRKPTTVIKNGAERE